MDIKLKSGRGIKVKDITLDERDELLDGVKYIRTKDGDVEGIEAMHSTITKWLRVCLNGQANDEFIMSLSFDERSEIFLKLQEKLITGEETASASN